MSVNDAGDGRTNPFNGSDINRAEIWNMLVARDIEAFVKADWSMVAGDFVEEGFFGIDAAKAQSANEWRLKFPSLGAYREEWLAQAKETQGLADPEEALAGIHAATRLTDIDIRGDVAVAHKKFNGHVQLKDGLLDRLYWQTLYNCRRVDGQWKIASFVGYMPFDLGRDAIDAITYSTAEQHVTAGPYAPAVTLSGDAKIVVISGQAPVNEKGDVVGDTLEEQSRLTLENCRTQLAAAGCGFEDVFKATIYLTDLSEWGAFNDIYKTVLKPPYPARTAIQAGLLPGFQVEIEMWAAKR